MNFSLKTTDGYTLFCQYSPADEAQGTLIFSHGFVEYSAHYSRLAKLFNAQGFNVLKYDLRGHGRSTAPASSVIHYTIFSDDLDEVVQWIKNKTPAMPVFVMGFSFGGMITALYTLLHPYETNGQILLGAGLTGSEAFLALKEASLSILDFLKIMGTSGDDGIRQLVKMNSPYVLKSIPRTFAQQAFSAAQTFIWDNVSSIRLSTLLIHGKNDPMISVHTSEQFLDAISSIDKKLVIIDDGEHDLLRTRQSEKVVALIASWCKERLI